MWHVYARYTLTHTHTRTTKISRRKCEEKMNQSRWRLTCNLTLIYNIPWSAFSSLKNFPAVRTNLPNSLPGCSLYTQVFFQSSVHWIEIKSENGNWIKWILNVETPQILNGNNWSLTRHHKCAANELYTTSHPLRNAKSVRRIAHTLRTRDFSIVDANGWWNAEEKKKKIQYMWPSQTYRCRIFPRRKLHSSRPKWRPTKPGSMHKIAFWILS